MKQHNVSLNFCLLEVLTEDLKLDLVFYLFLLLLLFLFTFFFVKNQLMYVQIISKICCIQPQSVALSPSLQYFLHRTQVYVLFVHTKFCIYSSKDLLAIAIRLLVKDIFSAVLLFCFILQTDYVTELYFSKLQLQFHLTRSCIYHLPSHCNSLTVSTGSKFK